MKLRLALLLSLFLAAHLPQAAAQTTDPLTVVDVKRSGDSLSVTFRANAAQHSVVVRLLENGALAGIPNWEPGTLARNEVRTWNYSLIRDITTATLAWQAAVFGEAAQSGTIPILVPTAGFTEPLSLVDVTRTKDALVVTMMANEALDRTRVRLMSGAAVLGLPEWQRAAWGAGEAAAWSFELSREVEKATLAWEVQRPSGTARTGSMEIQVPPIPAEAANATAARLVVTSATIQGTTATVIVANYGDGAARNVIVALEDAAQKRIGLPLTRLVASLAPGAQAASAFDLPRDVLDVVVALDQGNATSRTSVRLRAADGGNATAAPSDLNLSVTTDLPFREVDLGRSADFAIQVRNHGAPALVQLSVEGLPAGYAARFFVGGSAVPSLYLDHNQTRQVTLSVTVPTSKDEVDRTIDLSLVSAINGTEVRRLPMGIAVRGVGALDVSSPDGEAPLPPGGQATFQVVVRNTGSAPVFDVELDSRRPYGWTVRVEPRRLDRVEPGGQSAVSVEVRAPDVIGDGRYTVDVAARSGDTTSRYIPLALSVDEPEQGGGWLWGLFLALILGTLGFAGWWKWRR